MPRGRSSKKAENTDVARQRENSVECELCLCSALPCPSALCRGAPISLLGGRGGGQLTMGEVGGVGSLPPSLLSCSGRRSGFTMRRPSFHSPPLCSVCSKVQFKNEEEAAETEFGHCLNFNIFSCGRVGISCRAQLIFLLSPKRAKIDLTNMAANVVWTIILKS